MLAHHEDVRGAWIELHVVARPFPDVPAIEVTVALGVGPDAISGRTSSGALALDVPAAVALALGRHGIALDVSGPCTGCHDRWYSHRRGDAGRQAVVAWSEVA